MSFKSRRPVGLQYLLRASAQVLFQAQPKALQSSVIQGSFLIGNITVLNSRLVSAVISLVSHPVGFDFSEQNLAGAEPSGRPRMTWMCLP